MTGTIAKGIAGFYYVWSDGTLFECKARGKFRKNGLTPMVGDKVELSEDLASTASKDFMKAGTIDKILPRKNEFDRPPISNVDLVIIVAAAKDPVPLSYVIDRMAVSAELKNTEIAICINKEDLVQNWDNTVSFNNETNDNAIENIDSPNAASSVANDSSTTDDVTDVQGSIVDRLNEIYKGIYPVFNVSAKTGKGIEELKFFLQGKQAALAGPSGVGKSSLTNALLQGIENYSFSTSESTLGNNGTLDNINSSALYNCNCSDANDMDFSVHGKNVNLAEVGEISSKTLRGKNTTRHSELFLGDGFYLFDTPGFTSFETPELDERKLELYFPEFAKYLGKCRFDNCQHLSEPDCAVKEALNQGQVSQSRYGSYKSIYKEIKERHRF